MRMTVFDGRVLSGLVNKYVKAVDRAEKEIDRLNKKYNKLVFNGLRKIARTAIADFYHSYSPNSYNRHGDLYNSFQIVATDTLWDIYLGSEFMKYSHGGGKDGPVPNDYIYFLTMKEGSHGGAPHNGDYYWRRPYPEYTHWWPTPTPKGEKDIEGNIIKEANEFIDNMEQNWEDEFESKMTPILDDIRDSISRL